MLFPPAIDASTWARRDAETSPERGFHYSASRHSSSKPIVRDSVIRVEVEHLPKGSTAAVKTLWLWWSGPGEPDLDLGWRAYLGRFDIEHTFRFVKNTLGWTTPALRNHRELATRWSRKQRDVAPRV
ncbi:MAG: hypothetical protein ACYCPT_05625 [Acidimicrobiales bacterium]